MLELPTQSQADQGIYTFRGRIPEEQQQYNSLRWLKINLRVLLCCWRKQKCQNIWTSIILLFYFQDREVINFNCENRYGKNRITKRKLIKTVVIFGSGVATQ